MSQPKLRKVTMCRKIAIVVKRANFIFNTWFVASFLDVDECAGYYYCSQECKNTVGSYKCQCRSGYTLVGERNCLGMTQTKRNSLQFQSKWFWDLLEVLTKVAPKYNNLENYLYFFISYQHSPFGIFYINNNRKKLLIYKYLFYGCDLLLVRTQNNVRWLVAERSAILWYERL